MVIQEQRPAGTGARASCWACLLAGQLTSHCHCKDEPKTVQRPAAKQRQQAVAPPEEELKMVGLASLLAYNVI